MEDQEPAQNSAGQWFPNSSGFNINNCIFTYHSGPPQTTASPSTADDSRNPRPGFPPSHSAQQSQRALSSLPSDLSVSTVPIRITSEGSSTYHPAAYPTPPITPTITPALPESPPSLHTDYIRSPSSALASASISGASAAHAQSDNELYSQLLLPKKRGFPLWDPKPDVHLPDAYRAMGTSIGDVGYLDGDGTFNYLFNVCCLADDEVNVAGVPDGFRRLDVGPRDIRESEYDPASCIASHPSSVVQNVIPRQTEEEQIQGVPDEVGAGLVIKCHSSKGALLMLPEGGKRIDHKDVAQFRTYAKDYGKSWFSYTHQSSAQSLYLVTGCDKVRAWGMACFSDAVGQVHLELVPRAPGDGGARPKYRFTRKDFAATCSGADGKLQNQCVFLRGHRITLRKNPLHRKERVQVSAFPGLDISDGNLKSKGQNSSPSSSGLKRYFSGSSSGTGGSENLNSIRSGSHPSSQHSGSTEGNKASDSDSDDSLYFRAEPYHPSDVLNRWILSRHPEVDIAITHDDDWMGVIREASLPFVYLCGVNLKTCFHQEEEIPEDEELVRRIIEKGWIQIEKDNKGVCYGYFVEPHSVYSNDPKPFDIVVRKPTKRPSPTMSDSSQGSTLVDDREGTIVFKG
ncbi:hypothetical protein BDP27DRAFT_1428652 [Rhodocollybia butyracea]|uniref:Uncharacterized protein n=1 Tax=Rhodocollybia butyracea TaxID=206335 RepID=A0A9P5PB51_9AGAR|nr:hypothetical protein BDP27DRAFT_1428652 [Rhodocollybia butyracea]